MTTLFSSAGSGRCLFGAVLAADAHSAQKSGGVLKVYFFDSPASMSIHEEATIAAEGPMMGVFNNLVMYKQDVPQSGFQSIVPDLATDWSWDEDKTQLTFRLREGVKWHDGKPFTAKDVVCTWDLLTGKSSREAAHQPPQSVVPQSRRGRAERRQRSHLSAKAAATLLYRTARLRVYADLSVPCVAARHALASDRHRPLQICRVQAQRGDPGHQKPGLLEEGPAVSRRHRVYDHQEPVDRHPGLCRREGRHDLAVLSAGAALEGRQEAGPGSDLRAGAVERQPQRDDEPRGGALRQARAAPGGGADGGSQGLCRYLDRGQGRFRGCDAAAARGRMGHARRHAEEPARLQSRCREEPRRSPRASWKNSATDRTNG